MDDGKTRQTDAFFEAFRRAADTGAAGYDLVSFGDDPAMNDALCDLVLAGTKRATASLLRDVTEAGAPMPTVGGYFVVADGSRRPRCHRHPIGPDRQDQAQRRDPLRSSGHDSQDSPNRL